MPPMTGGIFRPSGEDGATVSAFAPRAPEASETARPLPTDLPSAAAFGQSVAADARDGGVDGPQIALRAHERNDLRKDAASPEPSETADATESADVHAPRVLPTAFPTAAVESHH